MERPDGSDGPLLRCTFNRDGEGYSTRTLQNWKYDEKAIKSSLIELIVLAELPFKFVEHPTFIKYSKNLQPKYNLPSRHTISRDVAKFYLKEKKKLVKFLGNPNHTIHLTMDTWTSTCQKIKYMVITVHANEVETIGLAVKYIKSSSQRIEKFKGCIKNTSDSNRHLMENGCIPKENEDEMDTPMEFLTDNEKKIRSSGVEDELKKYFKEPILELDDKEDFDILSRWKLDSPRFLIVSKMAKDILSIQLSTIAFESAFSISGRVLDPYRNALSPQIIEALLCTQSWVRTSQKSIYMDDLEDLLKDEDVIKEMKEALDKLKGANGTGISLD
nr:zinc finger BED domain-containing protein RICESLEEPER 2 [Tanacetum cinerariifolium]